MIDSLSKLLEMMRAHGAVRFYAKRLAPNDNSKNQIYLGGDFSALNVLPHGNITVDESVAAGSIRDRSKAPLQFLWLLDDGAFVPAEGAQLILYPKYPEVRLSGLLRGVHSGPNELIRSRNDGRVLFLGICDDRRIVGYVSDAESPTAKELGATLPLPQIGVFLELTSIQIGVKDTRELLLAALHKVHLKNWIHSQKLGADGTIAPYTAQNGGGYTLEAELGISPNGYAEPDYLGWEIKQYAVSDFTNYRPINPITLLTPEPNGGLYREGGVVEFLKRFGYADKRGRADRLNFGGVHRFGNNFHSLTGLALCLTGYDVSSRTISDLNGSLYLADEYGVVAASWNLRGLMEHWNRKHARAAYVPSLKRSPPPEYCFGSRVFLCEETDFLRFLDAVAKGAIYYDPGIKMERDRNSKMSVKKRSQFTTRHDALDLLYRKALPENTR